MRKYASEAFVAAFALLISMTTLSANAQMPPGMEEASGTYVDSDAGVEITFPDGWSGFVFGDEPKMVMVTPGGMSSFEEVDQTMILVASNKEDVDVTDPSDFTGGENAPDCNTPSFTHRTVSGVTGIESTIQCTDDAGKTIKMKIVGVETSTIWVMTGYWAEIEKFDSGLAAFDAAVSTLKVTGAVNTSMQSGGTMPGSGTSSGMVMVGGEEVEFSVKSSSQISNFALDEGAKKLTFKADGTGTSTEVGVGKVLEGPYTVMVDGQATANFEEKEDAGVKTITVPHSSGSHDITITGTQVVPEFPIAIIGAVAVLIGIVSVLTRTKLIKGRV